MKRIFLLLLVIKLFPVGSGMFAQTASDSISFYTLEDLKKHALEHNYEIQNSKAEIEKSKAQKWETTAVGLPKATISGSYQYLFEVPEMEMPLTVTVVPDQTNPFNHMHVDTSAVWKLGSESSGNIDFTVSQLIFSGEYIVGLQASKVYMRLSETAYQKKEQDVIADVSKTYYLALITEESIRVLDSVYLSMKDLLDETQALADEGFAESTDVEQLRLNVKNTENSIISFKNQREVVYNMLKLQIGMNLSDSLRLSSGLGETTEEVSLGLTAAEEFNASSTYEYQMLETQVELARLDMMREKSKYLPTLSAYYRHQVQINAPDFNFNPPDVIGAQVDFPIFTSWQRNARVKQKRIEYENTIRQKQNTEQALTLQYQRTLSDYDAALNQFNNRKESRDLARKVYENTLVKFKTGTESGLQLTQAQTQYFQALSSYYQSLSELIDRYIELEKLLNRL